MAVDGSYILGVIPARGGSKGLPRKNVLSLGGKPLIVHTIEAARRSKYLSRTIVSTDDEEIGRVSRAHGAEVPFVRPADLATDTADMVSVLRHATRHVEEEEQREADLVVLLQPTSPFRTAADIDACIDRFCELEPNVVFSAVRSDAHPEYNLVERVPGTAKVKLCRPPDENLNRRQEAGATWTSHGAVIVFRRSALFEYPHHLGMEEVAIYEMSEDRILDIDSERDLLWAEFLLTRSKTLNP